MSLSAKRTGKKFFSVIRHFDVMSDTSGRADVISLPHTRFGSRLCRTHAVQRSIRSPIFMAELVRLNAFNHEIEKEKSKQRKVSMWS